MKKKKILTFMIAFSSLLTLCAVPAFADDSSYLDLRISGTGVDYSYFQTADGDNPEWLVVLDPDYDRKQCVLRATLQNTLYYERGYMEIYEGTGNHSGSDGVEFEYQYRIQGIREHFYDGYVTVQGNWDLNWNYDYDY